MKIPKKGFGQQPLLIEKNRFNRIRKARKNKKPIRINLLGFLFLRPDRYTQRTICTRTIPLELQYVIEHKQDGFCLISLETALRRKAKDAAKHCPPNPIRVARMYHLARARDPSKTYGEIAEMFGVGRGVVHNHIRLVNRLPEEFVNWLEQQDDPTCSRFSLSGNFGRLPE